MKFIIDDADIKKVKDVWEYYPADGVTTNPSILAKSGKNPYVVLKEIREVIGNEKELHVQVISTKAEDMVREAKKIRSELGDTTYVKIPTTREGLKAIKLLAAENIPVTATAIYVPMQAYLAAKAGAKYVAPYVNRIDNLGADGIASVKKIHDILKNNKLDTEVLAASFKNSQQVQELCMYGVGAATIATDVIENLIKNDSVTAAVNAFTADFEKLCGEGKTMENC